MTKNYNKKLVLITIKQIYNFGINLKTPKSYEQSSLCKLQRHRRGDEDTWNLSII